MGQININHRLLLPVALCLLSVAILSACVRPGPGIPPETTYVPVPLGEDPAVSPAESPEPLSMLADNEPIASLLGPVPDYEGSPTPDTAHHEVASSETLSNTHVVQIGETLGMLAQRYETTIDELIRLNGLTNPDIIQVGQAIIVPGESRPALMSPDFKIIPDSELVYGPNAAAFELRQLAELLGSYLLKHEEEVEGQMMDGPAIVQLVADRHSVNPRLLMAILEHQTGWVTQADAATPVENIGNTGPNKSQLYNQLSWAANLLNLGFYGRAEGGLIRFTVEQTMPVFFSPTINHGTASVQLYFAAIPGLTYDDWAAEVGPDGFLQTYKQLFGNPFAYSFEPLIPSNLDAPELLLPWPQGETWYFTSGPHGAWNSGSAWGALDFAPPSDVLGCVTSDSWVTAMTGGVVTRSDHGAVVVDSDNDGYAGTGWAITYMHLERRDRVPVGTIVETGDRLGHPSCEGGFSNGTHVHVVRSYNGRWISADTTIPFEMSGWVSQGSGTEYNGYLTQNGVTVEACACRDEFNAVTHK